MTWERIKRLPICDRKTVANLLTFLLWDSLRYAFGLPSLTHADLEMWLVTVLLLIVCLAVAWSIVYCLPLNKAL